MTEAIDPVVRLEPWSGPWDPDDPDANFKSDVALYTWADPLETLTNLSAEVDIPVGALCRYVLAKWAAAGAEAILTLGPTAVNRLTDRIDQAEQMGTDEARLLAFHDLAAQLRWLRVPLDEPNEKR